MWPMRRAEQVIHTIRVLHKQLQHQFTEVMILLTLIMEHTARIM